MRATLLRIIAIAWLTVSLWLVALWPCNAAPLEKKPDAPHGQLLLIPSPEANLMMRTLVYRPPGAGPFPLAIISHGSSSNAALRAQQELSHFKNLALWFVRHGYVVAVSQRPGHGQTGGDWLEDYGSCDDPHYDRAGQAIADSIAAAVHYFVKQPYVKTSGVVLIGHSAGAWGSLAFASRNPRSVAAVVNFSGGLGGRSYDWPNRNCDPERLVKITAKFGRTARIPTIWIYARNDSYFGPDLSRAMAAAFRKAGGSVDYHLLPPIGDDGHFFIFAKDAASNWESLILAFLRRHRL